MTSAQAEAMAGGLHTERLTGGLPESLAVGDRVSYHSASAGRPLNAEVMAVLTGGLYRVESDQFLHGTKRVKSAKRSATIFEQIYNKKKGISAKAFRKNR